MKDKLGNLHSVEIEVPSQELDDVIHKAIERGKKEVHRQKAASRTFKAVACAVLLFFTAFVVGVNTVPVFAEGLKEITGLAGIVRVLQFEKNRGTGGDVTDGQDVGAIQWDITSEGESIKIHLLAEGAAALVPGYFEAVKEDYPHRLVLSLDGVRTISAAKFQVPAESALVEGIYSLVTLDDSRQRLVLAFTKGVEVEVVEVQDPAGIYVFIKEALPGEALPKAYSLRSASFEAGETVGVMEGVLKWELGGKEVRMLRDAGGTFFVEEGLYPSREEALIRQEELQKDMDFPLFIEEMEGSGLPRFIKP
jgi:hypothetical protein